MKSVLKGGRVVKCVGVCDKTVLPSDSNETVLPYDSDQIVLPFKSDYTEELFSEPDCSTPLRHLTDTPPPPPVSSLS